MRVMPTYVFFCLRHMPHRPFFQMTDFVWSDDWLRRFLRHAAQERARMSASETTREVTFC